MDLSFLIPSKIRRQVLTYFVENPDSQICIRELARELELSPQLVYRELVNLEGWGFLFSSKQANQRVFRINKNFPLYPPIDLLFKKLKEDNQRTFTIDKVLDWKKLAAEYKKIPIPAELIPGLTAKRRKPRAYAEEKSLKRKGML